jgi:hypothetical protein
MGFLDKLLGKDGKWFDCQTTLTGLSGTISRLPIPQARKDDGLFSAHFVPDDKTTLNNRNGIRNKNDMLELRFRLDQERGEVFWTAFQSIMKNRVFVTGALTNDDAKESKAEIHPLDGIWGMLPADAQPEWVKALRGNLKNPATEIQVYRVLAVSDASKSGAPASALENRQLRVPIPYPPGGAGNLELKYEVKPTCVHNTDFQLNHEPVKHRLELVVELKAVKNDGPTVFVADIAVFWN